MLYGSLEIPQTDAQHTRFLLQFFQDFYYLLLRHKERILSGSLRPTLTEQEAEENEGSDVLSPWDEKADQILNSLQNLLTSQALEANAEGGAFGAACYREAQYIMAALADEIFLGMKWEGRRYWEKSLLEQRLFGTHIAGSQFFKNLESFLKERDPLKQEVGILYLTTLGLGFRGQYRSFDEGETLKHYREQIFTFVYHRRPALFDYNGLIFPNAMRSTLEGGVEQDNQDARKWTLVFLCAFLGYLILSSGIWYGTTYTLSRTTDAILEDAATLT